MDCLIVLGARINPEGKAGRIARLRVEHALQVWREAGAAGCLLLTGGCSREGLEISEARAMADYALMRAEAQGGPELRERLEACLLLEEASRTTWDSACHTLPLVREMNFKAVGLVSDALHLKRAHYLFRRRFGKQPFILHPLPAPGVVRHYWRHRRYLWLARIIFRETGAWLKVLTRRGRQR